MKLASARERENAPSALSDGATPQCQQKAVSAHAWNGFLTY
jgi:hypothetical protein